MDPGGVWCWHAILQIRKIILPDSGISAWLPQQSLQDFEMAEVGICGKGNLLIYVCFQIIIIIPPNYGDINQSPPGETSDPRNRNSSLGASSVLPGVTTSGTVASEKDGFMSETMIYHRNLPNPHLFEPLFCTRAWHHPSSILIHRRRLFFEAI
jgi:hypothetical protein